MTDSEKPSRRMFTASAGAAFAGMVLTACGPKRLYEVPQHKLKASIAEMERRYKEQLGQDIRVSDQGPLPGVHFAYALDISRCIGCRRCVYACVAENNQSRDPQIHWIRVFSMEKEKGVDFTHANPTTIRPRSPKKATSTFPSVASSARIRPVPRFAPHAPPGPKRTASWSSITTGASAAAIA